MGKQRQHDILGDFLQCLGVPHTPGWTAGAVAAMPFPSLFGLSKLLQQCGVSTCGAHLNDKNELAQLSCPFIAHTPAGFMIVTEISGSTVSYLTQGAAETIPLQDFIDASDGNVLLARPLPGAAEPDYSHNHMLQIAGVVKKIALRVCIIALFGYLFITNGIWKDVSAILVTLLDIGGLWLTWMLLQKSLRIHNSAADRVCGILQAGGCDDILKTGASTFFGIVSWSEVGFTYFSVSLLTLLFFPQHIPAIALCTACCLPFTIWSIWYQKFRAKAWCTLCVSVQCTLWLLFFCYLGGGWLSHIFPLPVAVIPLGLTYLTVLLVLNRLMPKLENKNTDDNN